MDNITFGPFSFIIDKNILKKKYNSIKKIIEKEINKDKIIYYEVLPHKITKTSVKNLFNYVYHIKAQTLNISKKRQEYKDIIEEEEKLFSEINKEYKYKNNIKKEFGRVSKFTGIDLDNYNIIKNIMLSEWQDIHTINENYIETEEKQPLFPNNVTQGNNATEETNTAQGTRDELINQYNSSSFYIINLIDKNISEYIYRYKNLVSRQYLTDPTKIVFEPKYVTNTYDNILSLLNIQGENNIDILKEISNYQTEKDSIIVLNKNIIDDNNKKLYTFDNKKFNLFYTDSKEFIGIKDIIKYLRQAEELKYKTLQIKDGTNNDGNNNDGTNNDGTTITDVKNSFIIYPIDTEVLEYISDGHINNKTVEDYGIYDNYYPILFKFENQSCWMDSVLSLLLYSDTKLVRGDKILFKDKEDGENSEFQLDTINSHSLNDEQSLINSLSKYFKFFLRKIYNKAFVRRTSISNSNGIETLINEISDIRNIFRKFFKATEKTKTYSNYEANEADNFLKDLIKYTNCPTDCFLFPKYTCTYNYISDDELTYMPDENELTIHNVSDETTIMTTNNSWRTIKYKTINQNFIYNLDTKYLNGHLNIGEALEYSFKNELASTQRFPEYPFNDKLINNYVIDKNKIQYEISNQKFEFENLQKDNLLIVKPYHPIEIKEFTKTIKIDNKEITLELVGFISRVNDGHFTSYINFENGSFYYDDNTKSLYNSYGKNRNLNSKHVVHVEDDFDSKCKEAEKHIYLIMFKITNIEPIMSGGKQYGGSNIPINFFTSPKTTDQTIGLLIRHVLTNNSVKSFKSNIIEKLMKYLLGKQYDKINFTELLIKNKDELTKLHQNSKKYTLQTYLNLFNDKFRGLLCYLVHCSIIKEQYDYYMDENINTNIEFKKYIDKDLESDNNLKFNKEILNNAIFRDAEDIILESLEELKKTGINFKYIITSPFKSCLETTKIVKEEFHIHTDNIFYDLEIGEISSNLQYNNANRYHIPSSAFKKEEYRKYLYDEEKIKEVCKDIDSNYSVTDILQRSGGVDLNPNQNILMITHNSYLNKLYKDNTKSDKLNADFCGWIIYDCTKTVNVKSNGNWIYNYNYKEDVINSYKCNIDNETVTHKKPEQLNQTKDFFVCMMRHSKTIFDVEPCITNPYQLMDSKYNFNNKCPYDFPLALKEIETSNKFKDVKYTPYEEFMKDKNNIEINYIHEHKVVFETPEVVKLIKTLVELPTEHNFEYYTTNKNDYNVFTENEIQTDYKLNYNKDENIISGYINNIFYKFETDNKKDTKLPYCLRKRNYLNHIEQFYDSQNHCKAILLFINEGNKLFLFNITNYKLYLKLINDINILLILIYESTFYNIPIQNVLKDYNSNVYSDKLSNSNIKKTDGEYTICKDNSVFTIDFLNQLLQIDPPNCFKDYFDNSKEIYGNYFTNNEKSIYQDEFIKFNSLFEPEPLLESSSDTITSSDSSSEHTSSLNN